MTSQKRKSDWALLFREACNLIDQVNSSSVIVDSWTFGGGTAMMLQIDHRESHDVDIFISDPQLLPFLDPKTHDFKFEIKPADYKGDGAKFLKLAFEMGEIDFIVGNPITPDPTKSTHVEGREVLLETVPEIIAKKIFHRGTTIKPRDIFDIAAAARQNEAALLSALSECEAQARAAVQAIEKLNPEFVNAAIAELAIKEPFLDIASSAIERAVTILKRVKPKST